MRGEERRRTEKLLDLKSKKSAPRFFLPLELTTLFWQLVEFTNLFGCYWNMPFCCFWS
jgi:hypothetical protein